MNCSIPLINFKIVGILLAIISVETVIKSADKTTNDAIAYSCIDCALNRKYADVVKKNCINDIKTKKYFALNAQISSDWAG